MRSIFAAIIVLSASTVAVHAADAKEHARIQRGYGSRQAPASHRQSTHDEVTGANQIPFDKKSVEKRNELFDLPPSQEKVIGADQVASEENALAKMIEQENARLDRELRGICRGC
jgi:hypothetical protein